jgi:hypothetical protein
MLRRSIFGKNKVGLPANPAYITKWNTENAGSPNNQIIIPLRGNFFYDCTIDWGNGVVENYTTSNSTSFSHIYSTPGIYTITISGTFPAIYFNNGGDKLKLIGIIQNGSPNWSGEQLSAYYGCTNLTSLPSDMIMDYVVNGQNMFYNTKITGLPNGCTFKNLTNGNYMFRGVNTLTLPDSITFENLDSGVFMFFSATCPTLPSNLKLNKLTNGAHMFRGVIMSGEVPVGMSLSKLTNGLLLFSSANFSPPSYSDLLIRMEASNPNNTITFNAGISKYNTNGSSARNALIARSWDITDGGPAI